MNRLTASRYAFASFFSSSDSRPPYRITSSLIYRSRSLIRVIPLSKRVWRMISYDADVSVGNQTRN